MNIKSGKQSKEYFISLVFILLSVIFWGYSFISTKIVLTEVPPVSIAFFRQIIAAVTLIIWLAVTKGFSRISFKQVGLIVISGFFGIVLYFICENNGLKFTTASNASMIVSAVPLFTMVTEALFYKMKITAKMITCLMLSIIGVYMIISINGKIDFSSSMLVGNLLAVGAMASWVIYTVFNKSLSEKYSSVELTTYQTIAAIFIFIPFTIPEMKAWKGISPVPLLNLIYLGVFCSAFAYFFYIYAAKRLGATVSSAFLNLIPVVSVICGYLILGEKLTLLQFSGMLLILISLFYLSRKEKEKETDESVSRGGDIAGNAN